MRNSARCNSGLLVHPAHVAAVYALITLIRPAGLGWVGRPQNHHRGDGGSHGTPALLFTHSLALAGRVGRETLHERVGIVLQDVMDGKGKRLEINVRPVLATELQVISEGLEVHADLDLFINIHRARGNADGC
jgi:hypothetical protein